jgi:putative flippase GtrA
VRRHHGQVARFVVVGTLAAAVHLLVVMALVRWLGWVPLAANLAGWLVAFWVSFFGHYGWTFRGTTLVVAASAKRFFVLSASGFLVNEALYATALRWSGLRFDLLLAGVLIVMAVLTFVASRLWAFRGSDRPA